MKLKVNYTSQKNIHVVLTTTVKSETHHSGDFTANGKVLISKYETESQLHVTGKYTCSIDHHCKE